jgi:hypothetical protein
VSRGLRCSNSAAGGGVGGFLGKRLRGKSNCEGKAIARENEKQ